MELRLGASFEEEDGIAGAGVAGRADPGGSLASGTRREPPPVWLCLGLGWDAAALVVWVVVVGD
jgi:hypothetical protein